MIVSSEELRVRCDWLVPGGLRCVYVGDVTLIVSFEELRARRDWLVPGGLRCLYVGVVTLIVSFEELRARDWLVGAGWMKMLVCCSRDFDSFIRGAESA